MGSKTSEDREEKRHRRVLKCTLKVTMVEIAIKIPVNDTRTAKTNGNDFGIKVLIKVLTQCPENLVHTMIDSYLTERGHPTVLMSANPSITYR